VLDDHRHGRGDHIGGVAGDDEVDLVDVEQLRIDARHGRWVALVVIDDDFDRAAEQAALGVHVVALDVDRQQRRLAVGGERPGLRHAQPDADRVGGLGHRR